MFYIFTPQGDKVKQGDLVWFATRIDSISGDIDEYSLGILLEISDRDYASILYKRSVVKIWLKNILSADYG